MFHQVVYHRIFTVFLLFNLFIYFSKYSCGCVTLEYHWNGVFVESDLVVADLAAF